MTTKTKYTASELERFLAGELDEERTEAIERAAEEDRELKAWIDDRRAEQRAFLLDTRRKPFAKLVEEAGAAKERSWLARWLPGLSLVAAAAVAVVVFIRPAPEEHVGFRNKGGLSVKAAVLEGERTQMFEGEQLHPGSRLRLSVDDPRGGYVTVLLEESSGEISVLYGPDEMGRLSPGTHRLPGSLELDQELGRERLYVLMSDDEPAIDVWIRELRNSHQKTGFIHEWLPEGTTRVSTLEYEKVQ